MRKPAWRQLATLRGRESETAAAARLLLEGWVPQQVLWVGREPAGPWSWSPPARLRQQLGSSWDAVVLDLHPGFDPDLLGQVQGLIRGGGALLLRLPPLGERPPPSERLEVLPWGREGIGERCWERLERALSTASLRTEARQLIPPGSAEPPDDQEQSALVQRLCRVLQDDSRACVVLRADRGRGKSAALGRLLSRLQPAEVVLLGPSASSVDTLRSWAGPAAPPWTAALDFLRQEPPAGALVLIDEAAQLPLDLLQRLCHHARGSGLLLSTTEEGYEGSGRGFGLRFLPWLQRQRAVLQAQLQTPIRWSAGDPLEAWCRRLLLLERPPLPAPPGSGEVPLELERVDREALARQEPRLSSLFGLLVQAHYRTTPRDLQHLLDAPNLRIYQCRRDEEVLAATLVASEGELSAEQAEALWRGRRLRGQALTDGLVNQLGLREAGSLRIRRSVRIATCPSWRRRGLAAQLVERLHRDGEREEVDLYGTLFGASPELLQFRQQLGYRLARVGLRLGERTGLPSVMMLRPGSSIGAQLLRRAQRLSRWQWPWQRRLMEADSGLRLDPSLLEALEEALGMRGEPVLLTREEILQQWARYLAGQIPSDVVSRSLRARVLAEPAGLERLSPEAVTLVEGRLLQGLSWTALLRQGSWASLRLLQRGLREALQLGWPLPDDHPSI